jgi:hypothetical protein
VTPTCTEHSSDQLLRSEYAENKRKKKKKYNRKKKKKKMSSKAHNEITNVLKGKTISYLYKTQNLVFKLF